ncbi:MAG: hypothetical protein JWN09_3032, partial [Microbacteriaceae bacterium]|nr:hypothetical protein [Microbacteriaceae bacterium]
MTNADTATPTAEQITTMPAEETERVGLYIHVSKRRNTRGDRTGRQKKQ